MAKDILGRLPRSFQGRKAGDSHTIKFTPYRLGPFHNRFRSVHNYL